MATVAGSLRNKVLVLDDVTTGDLTVTGSVTISGTATTLNSTNTSINDHLIELNAGLTGSNPNDTGLILERGSTGNNVFIGWDESADKVVVATTTADGTATGNLSLSYANFQAASATFTGGITAASNSTFSSNVTINNNLYIGDGNDGYFYNDVAGRTAFRSGDFYIQDTVTNFYNYATNQYYGDNSGDNIHFRGNTVDGTGWELSPNRLKVAAAGTSPTDVKLHVGTINSTGSSAIAQFGGFLRAANYIFLHDGAGSSNSVSVRYTGGHIDLTQGEGSGGTPATRVNSIASPDGTQLVFPNNNGMVMIGSSATPASKLHVNSGSTNVVATFQSTDGIAGIKLQDSAGNVEISNSGSVFRVQPSGSTPVVEINPADAPGSIFTTKNVGLGDSSSNIKVAYPGPDAQWSASGTSTGQIIIDLPGTLSNYDMMYMEIDIYEYSGDAATKLIIGGHNWNSGGNSGTSNTMWHNVDVRVLGEFQKPIYFGWRNNGSVNKRVIVLGDPSSSWSYGTVHVAKVSGAQSFYSGGTDWASGWNVTQTTGSSDYTKSPSTDFNGADRRVFRVIRAIQGNRIYADADMRSPIYYDLNDTAYRIDGSSTSKLKNLDIGNTDSTVGVFKVYDSGNNALELKSTGSNAFRFDMVGTSATGQLTFQDLNIDISGGHFQHFGTFYSRANLNVLNAAGNGWHTWATRNNGKFDLNVNNISSSAITTNNSILISYSGNDGAGNDAGLKIMNDSSDWGAYIRKASGAAYGLRIDSGNDHALSIYTAEGGSTRSFYINGGTGLVSTLSHGTSANWKQAYDNYITGIGVSGTTTKTITLTQRDGGTISTTFTDLQGSSADGVVDSLSFSAGTVTGGTSGTGVLTLGRSGSLSDLTVDLDGRYLQRQYMNNWTRVGYGDGGTTKWHKLCTITITGSYHDYNVGFYWTDRYDRGEASIHVHSDNDNTADVWAARFVSTTNSNRKSASDIMYTQSGSTVEIFVRTPSWREFDYIRNDAVTEGTPSITWYDESTTTEYTSQPSNTTAFTDMTPISQSGYNTSFSGDLQDKDNTQYYLDPNSTSVLSQLDVATNIRHMGDTDTYIQFTDGEIDFFANGSNTFMTSSGGFVVNPNSNNYDFIVRGDNESNLIYGDASTDRVGIGTATPSYDLDIQGASAGLRVSKSANDARVISQSTTAGGWFESISPNYYSGMLHVIGGTEQWALGTLQGQSQYTLRRGRSGAIVWTALTDGKVGINNNTPQRRFVVTEGSAGDAADNSGILSLTVGSGANTDSKLAFGINSNHQGWIHVVKPGSNVYPLILNPTGSSNGMVGIGDTTPIEMLDVYGRINVQDGRVWDATTQGTTRGTIHLDPNSGTDHAGSGITFGASDAGSGTTAQAGIYIRSDGSYGTKMYFSTTDSYSSGSKTGLRIDHAGVVSSTRSRIESASDMRASIFYDTGNTSYFLDPANTGQSMTVAGSITVAANTTSTQFYTSGWFRNNASGHGLYNQATGQHFYSDDDDYWNVAGGTAANGIRFRDDHAGTIRGYVYANSSNEVGLLDASAHWAVRHKNDSFTEFRVNNVAKATIDNDGIKLEGDLGNGHQRALRGQANLAGANLLTAATDIARRYSNGSQREFRTFVDGNKVACHYSQGVNNSGSCYQWISTEWVDVDPEKDYEYTIWVQAEGDHNVYMGWHEQNASGSQISSNPYMHTSTVDTNGGWVKLTARLKGHRTPAGQSDSEGTDRYVSNGSWIDEGSGVSSNDGVMHSTTRRIMMRFGTCYGTANTAKTYFYLPSIREISYENAQQAFIVPNIQNNIVQAGSMHIGRTDWSGYTGLEYRDCSGSQEFRMSSTSGDLNLRVDGWGLFHGSEGVQAGIFKDINNAGYYVHPDGASVLNGLTLNGNLRVNAGSSDYTGHSNVDETILRMQTDFNAAGDQNLQFVNHNGNWQDGTSGSDTAYGWMWGYANSIRAGIHYDHRGIEKFDFYSSYGDIRFRTPAGVNGNISPIGSESSMPARLTIGVGGSVTAHNNMKAPVYYDSDNTAYYLDPGHSTLAAYVNGTIKINSSHAHGNFVMHYNHGNDTDSSQLCAWVSEPGMTYNAGGIGVNVHESGPYYGRFINSGYGVYARFKKSDGLFEIYTTTATRGNNGGQGTRRFYVDASGNSHSIVSSRAPIFYDSDNTGYYTNPASTSLLNGLQLAGSTLMTAEGATNLKTRFIMGKASGNTNNGELYINYGQSSDVHIGAGGGASSLHVSASVRAPIFYDSSNTSYYVDPYDRSFYRLGNPTSDGDAAGRRGLSWYHSMGPDMTLWGYGSGSGVNAIRIWAAAGANSTVAGDKFEFKHDGSLHADGDITAFSTTTTSDIRLKENVRDLEGSLDKTLQLRGVKFDWKEEGKGNDQLGFIAQEIEEVLPEVVNEVDSLNATNEKYKVVNYQAVVPVLVEAIKELKAEIDELKEQLKKK